MGKNQVYFTFVALCLISFPTVFSQDVISWPGGRYALSSDGNMHDPDDIGAIPMIIAMMYYAGFKDQIVHFEYNNHLGLSHPTKLKGMTESSIEAINRFGVNKKVTFDCQTQLAEATKNFVKQDFLYIEIF